MSRNSTMDLTTGHPLKQLLFFSLPLVAGTLFQQFYSFADTVMVGRFLGESALAAVGTTYSLHFLTLGFVLGACAGFGIPLAQAVGAKDRDEFRRYFWNGVWLCCLLGVAFTALTYAFAVPMLRLIHTPEEILPQAASYIRIIFLGIPASILYNFCAGALRAAGDSRRPTLFLLVSSFLNIVLDYLLLAVFPLGVVGAALATVASQLVSGLLNLYWLACKTDLLQSCAGLRGFSRRHAAALCRVGLPMGFEYSVSAIGAVLLQSAINALGTAAIAGQTAGDKIRQMFTLPMESVGMGMATFVGQNEGARRYDRIRQGIRDGLIIPVDLLRSRLGRAFLRQDCLHPNGAGGSLRSGRGAVGGVSVRHQLPFLLPRRPDDPAQYPAGHGLQPARCPQRRGRADRPRCLRLGCRIQQQLSGHLPCKPRRLGAGAGLLHRYDDPLFKAAADPALLSRFDCSLLP